MAAFELTLFHLHDDKPVRTNTCDRQSIGELANQQEYKSARPHNISVRSHDCNNLFDHHCGLFGIKKAVEMNP
jgi:hypothetical protein